MQQLEAHEFANLIPDMTPEQYEQLVEDIGEHGLLQPIVLYEDRILDGRHRYRACCELQERGFAVDPEYKEFNGNRRDAYAFVLSLNLHRRHLEYGQRCCLGELKYNPMPRGGDRKSEEYQFAKSQIEKPTLEQIAKEHNVGTRGISDAHEIRKKAPDLFDIVLEGGMGLRDAQKEVRERERRDYIEQQRQEIAEQGIISPTGVYDVIAIDPPWPYGTEYDPEGRRAANPYPEMSLEQIASIQLPAADDCVLWLWTTHKFMRHSFELLDGWGFRDVAILTWEKDRMGLGSWLRSQSEFCIMAVKGHPVINLTNQTTVIHGELREHSRKPDSFYQMVNGLCIGRKLDYFSREQREGWVQYGNDTEHF